MSSYPNVKPIFLSAKDKQSLFGYDFTHILKPTLHSKLTYYVSRPTNKCNICIKICKSEFQIRQAFRIFESQFDPGTLCCGNSKESSHCSNYFENPQHRIWLTNKRDTPRSWWSTLVQGTFSSLVLVCLPRDHE